MRMLRMLLAAALIFSSADAYACTIFTVSKGSAAFFTGTNDYITTDSVLWSEPAGTDSYGVLFIGESGNIQQGFNEAGLAYDANGLPEQLIPNHEGFKACPDKYTLLSVMILKECGTVEEVILWVKTHQWHSHMQDQLHFADADGDAVVISAGADGRIAFTRKPEGDSFLVSTNFNLADVTNGKYPCKRYDTAEKMLNKIISGDELTAEAAAEIAGSVSINYAYGRTLYAQSADLKNGLLYIYYMMQYGEPVVLDIKKEIAAGTPRILSSLFSESVRGNAAKKLKRARRQPLRLLALGIAGTAVSLFFLIKLRKKKRIPAAFALAFSLLIAAAGFLYEIKTAEVCATAANPVLPPASYTAAE